MNSSLSLSALFALSSRLSWANPFKPPALKNSALSRLAWQSTHLQGTWNADAIEGTWPGQISGKWLKIGPGRKENFGVPLNHFFDGDAYLTEIAFTSTGAMIKTGFLQTPFF